MAADNTGNLLVTFQFDASTYLAGECQTQLDTTTDPDFYEGFTAGNFSEITDINVGLKLTGSDSGQSSKGYGKYGAWNYNEQADATNFRIEFEEVQMDRPFDISSPTLFQKSCLKQTFARVIVVRRRDDGTGGGPRPFVRLEFTDVLFTNVTWQDGPFVKEKDTFRCRSFQSHYRLTDDAGNMGGYTALPPATWAFDIERTK